MIMLFVDYILVTLNLPFVKGAGGCPISLAFGIALHFLWNIPLPPFARGRRLLFMIRY